MFSRSHANVCSRKSLSGNGYLCQDLRDANRPAKERIPGYEKNKYKSLELGKGLGDLMREETGGTG